MKQKLIKLEGSNVQEVIAGGAGSLFTLVLLNESSEFTLTIDCTWRLENNGEIISGWNEEDEMQIELNKLKNKKLVAVLSSSHFDLDLSFENNYKLRVFCDRTPNEDKDGEIDNWVLSDVNNNKSYRYTNLFTFDEQDYS